MRMKLCLKAWRFSGYDPVIWLRRVGRTYAELLYQKADEELCAVSDSGAAKGEGFIREEVEEPIGRRA